MCRSCAISRRFLSRITSPRPRVSRVVDLRERLEIEVRVDLRGRDAGVAEHLLHRAQVLRGLQHVAREGMAQHVRVHVLGQPRRFAQVVRRCHTRLGVIRGGARRRKARALPARQCWSGCAAKLARRCAHFAPTGTVRLRALAGHGNFALRRIIAQVARRSSPTRTRRVDSSNIAARLAAERRFHQRRRGALRASTDSALGSGRAALGARIPSTGFDAAAMAREPAEIAAPGRQRERQRARR